MAQPRVRVCVQQQLTPNYIYLIKPVIPEKKFGLAKIRVVGICVNIPSLKVFIQGPCKYDNMSSPVAAAAVAFKSIGRNNNTI